MAVRNFLLFLLTLVSLLDMRSEIEMQTPFTQDQLEFYKPSIRIKHWLWSDRFELRFPQIKGSLIQENFFVVMWRMIRFRMNYTNEGYPEDLGRLDEELPVVRPSFSIDRDKIGYTWIGHSTAVISFGDEGNFMIDPVFSERASPVQFAGPRRFRPLPCTIDQIPISIDAVLVSHDHYDHMDSQALEDLHRKNPQCQFFAGLQSEDAFPKGCKINTLDWTETKDISINGKIFKVTFVPASHWSRRGIADQGYRLWGGFVIESPNGKKVYYSGDTGYSAIFNQLGQVFGGFDLSILPIGAYLPRQFLRSQHIDPEQAVKVHLEIKSKKSVGVHWGTFALGFEHYLAAPKDLKAALQKRNMSLDSFVTVQHGGQLQVDYH